MWFALLLLVVLPFAAIAQDAQPVCSFNQIFNGQICTCAPGYFSSANDESKTRCEDECEEVFSSYFARGKCVNDIFGKLSSDQQPACNMRCGVRLRWWTSIGIFIIFAAAVCTLFLTLPMCIATCCSCLHAKRANKNAKRVAVESQSASASSKEQQVATMGYNPYAYWPYYGRA